MTIYNKHREAIAPIVDFALNAAFVGSRVTCDPAPTDTDRDILVLVSSFGHTYNALAKAGWTLGGSGEEDDDFESWTKGDDNLILTESRDFFNRFVTATKIAGRLNILNKSLRTELFQAFLYDNVYCHRFDAANRGTLEEMKKEMPF